MKEEEFNILMKKLYPDKEFREAVIKGAKIATSLEEYYETKTQESKIKLDEAIESGKLYLRTKGCGKYERN